MDCLINVKGNLEVKIDAQPVQPKDLPVPMAAAAFVEEPPAYEEEKKELKVEIVRLSVEEEKANAAPPSPEIIVR